MNREALIFKATAKTELLRRKARQKGLLWFMQNIFSASFPNFVGGKYIESVAERMMSHNYTMDVTGRDHFKSTRLYAEIMYHIFIELDGWEAHYMSYSRKMAEYHLLQINQLIMNNPHFTLCKNHKPLSDYMLIYSWDNSKRIMVKPKGMFEFKRGIHSEAIYIDDAFRDVDQERDLDPLTIRKVNDVMKSEILPMVKKGGICRVVGTPQTDTDFFFDKALHTQFITTITPAIVDNENKISLWPEWLTWQDLDLKRQQLGDIRFSREYMARPLRNANSYIAQEHYFRAEKLEAWRFADHSDKLEDKLVVAGFDIGKKQHPSHLAIFIKSYRTDNSGEQQEIYSQIYSEWMDKIPYSQQIEKLNLACEYFNISKLRYDNTRSEFESYAEKGDLHYAFEPVVFTAKQKSKMAVKLEGLFDRQHIRVVKEERQAKQLLSVDQNLEAVTSPLGHGDSFWSIALAISDSDVMIRIRSV